MLPFLLDKPCVRAFHLKSWMALILMVYVLKNNVKCILHFFTKIFLYFDIDNDIRNNFEKSLFFKAKCLDIRVWIVFVPSDGSIYKIPLLFSFKQLALFRFVNGRISIFFYLVGDDYLKNQGAKKSMPETKRVAQNT